MKKAEANITNIVLAFLDVTDGMKPHDYFSHMGGTQERADEVAEIRQFAFDLFGKEWLRKKNAQNH